MRTTFLLSEHYFPYAVNYFTIRCGAHQVQIGAQLEFPSFLASNACPP